MPDRRSLLRGLAGLPAMAAASTPEAAVAISGDPIIRLRGVWLHQQALCDRNGISEQEAEACYQRHVAAEREAIRRRATTVPGAICSLEWAQAEFREHHDRGCQGDALLLALLDGALGVLHRLNA